MSKKDSIAGKSAKENTSSKNQNNATTESSMQNYDCLRLKNQLCFPLYACSKEIIRRYKPVLDKLDLTYTQYITMMVLWEKERLHVGELGECLFLDSGTLTPLLKSSSKRVISPGAATGKMSAPWRSASPRQAWHCRNRRS